jgi:isochorismate pyruvate lyase
MAAHRARIAAMTEVAPEMAEIRTGIDALDAEIVRLLARREGLVRRAAPFKADVQAVRAPDRVAQVVARVRDLAVEAGAQPDVIERIYRGIIQAAWPTEIRTGTSRQRASARQGHQPTGLCWC